MDISIDTEGTEYKILDEFDFDKWGVDLFSVEQNHAAQEQKIDAPMKSRGYERCMKTFSGCDTWYAKI
jgi:hypothetical protein